MNLFDELGARRQFILYRLIPKPDGKTDKVPAHPLTGENIDAQDPAHWVLPSEARMWAAQWGAGYGVGLVIAEGSGLFCVDLDGCRDGAGWQPYVVNFIGRFSGAYVETSVSGQGVHIIGAYTGAAPAHGTRNKDYRAELYTKSRFIAVTGQGAAGSVLTDCTQQLGAFAAQFFPPHGSGSAEWTDGPCEGSTPITNDEELIARALRSSSAQSVWGGRASFADLWRANADALGRAFPPQNAHDSWDRSAADQALANHLAWWTCKDCTRMDRLMRQSALRRDKWERQDYMRSTILRACADQRECYKGAPHAEPAQPAHAVTVIPPPPAEMPTVRAAARRPATVGAYTALPVELSTEIRYGRNGELIPDEENIGIILERDPALQGIVRYNEFSGELILTRPITADDTVVGERGLPRPWIDEDTIVLQRFIQRYIIPKIGRDRIEAVVSQHAKYHCAFHPIRDYLQSLAWDNTERLHTWLQVYFGAGRQPAQYLAAVGSAWLISGVARIFEPGCKADNALVLEGAQGTYKSTALRTLAGNDYFSDSLSADLSHKDARDHLRGKWLIELAELSQFKRSEIETVKAFISRQVEQYRPSYGRHEISFPRQCIFAGSTNDETYLVDRTGNRRWWTVSCTRVDINALVRDRDQLWAEATARYRAGEPWWLTKDIEALADAEASLRVAHDPWTADVAKITAEAAGTDVSPGEVMARMSLPTTERHDRHAGRVGQILRDLGWQRGKRHKTRGQLYVRPMPVIPPPPASVA